MVFRNSVIDAPALALGLTSPAIRGGRDLLPCAHCSATARCVVSGVVTCRHRNAPANSAANAAETSSAAAAGLPGRIVVRRCCGKHARPGRQGSSLGPQTRNQHFRAVRIPDHADCTFLPETFDLSRKDLVSRRASGVAEHVACSSRQSRLSVDRFRTGGMEWDVP